MIDRDLEIILWNEIKLLRHGITILTREINNLMTQRDKLLEELKKKNG